MCGVTVGPGRFLQQRVRQREEIEGRRLLTPPARGIGQTLAEELCGVRRWGHACSAYKSASRTNNTALLLHTAPLLPLAIRT